MILYLFTAIGFPPGGSGQQTCIKIGNRTKGETLHKTIQKYRIHKIENKNTKQKTNIKGIL